MVASGRSLLTHQTVRKMRSRASGPVTARKHGNHPIYGTIVGLPPTPPVAGKGPAGERLERIKQELTRIETSAYNAIMGEPL